MAAQGKTSKTARSSTPTGKAGAFEMSPDIPRLVPTGDGNYCYVRVPTGATTHVKVGSDSFFEAINSLCGGPAAKKSGTIAASYAATYNNPDWKKAAELLLGD
jgi:hypothetical protein